MFTKQLPLVLLLPLLSGCIHAHAKSAADMPPLDVPAPPPRVVQTNADEEPAPPVGLVQEPGRNLPPPSARPPTPAPRADTAKPEAPKVETPVAPEAPKAADDAARAQPSPTLQTAPAGQEAEVEAKILTVLSRASNDLNRTDYNRLNRNAKSQYDSAKRFISLAEEALRSKNFVYANTLADKAADLAAQLAGR